jgi:exosortase
VLFKAVGVPVFRDGLYFSLPGINIEVAKQCSGIRSTIGVFITGAVAAHLFLRRPLSGVLLILCIVPITIFKNAVRITTITLLAVYVDPKFLTHHWIHKSGGMVFAAMALGLVALVLWGVRRAESSKLKGRAES